MRGGKGSNHLARNVVLVVLLAVLCVGAVELAACSRFAPETYDRIVAPARYAASVVVDTGKAALDAAGRFCQAVGTKAAELAAAAARQVSEFARRTAESWDEWVNPPEPIPEAEETAEPEPEPDPSPAPSQTPVYRYPASDPALTEVLEADGKQILTGGSVDVTYFCQSDEEWADKPYGTDPIGPYGCGPTAMAIAVASMTDTETDPAAMAAWAAEHGYWARGSGSYHSIVQGTARAFGLEAEALTERTPDALRQALENGGLVVALMGPGHFTSGGHFIVVRGVTLTGDILVADPNSLELSLEVWDPQIILDELSSARDNGAPLWVISAPEPALES